jgi:hypothetical protein
MMSFRDANGRVLRGLPVPTIENINTGLDMRLEEIYELLNHTDVWDTGTITKKPLSQ